MIKGTARMRHTMTSDGSPDQIIALADELHPDGLDSLDLGDALGALIEYARGQSEYTDGGGSVMIAGEGFTITVDSEWELFEWEGLED